MPLEGEPYFTFAILSTHKPECGNMLIMTLSYTQKTGDNSIITGYVSTIRTLAMCLTDFYRPICLTNGLVISSQRLSFLHTRSARTTLLARLLTRLTSPSRVLLAFKQWPRSLEYLEILSTSRTIAWVYQLENGRLPLDENHSSPLWPAMYHRF